MEFRLGVPLQQIVMKTCCISVIKLYLGVGYPILKVSVRIYQSARFVFISVYGNILKLYFIEKYL